MIKTHKELADQIAGKTILHLNSLGKDSVLCLDWLVNFAHPAKIISVYCQFITPSPGDEEYFEYLKNRYPSVEFVTETNPNDLSNMITGLYQSPLDLLNIYQNYEYNFFDFSLMIDALKKEHNCDYVCMGHSRSESFRRATIFHKKGILFDEKIYPLGMMSKKQIHGLIKSTGTKLHPVYKFCSHTLDYPSYYKYRSTFIANPEFKKQKYNDYPLLALDEYRWEVLFGT